MNLFRFNLIIMLKIHYESGTNVRSLVDLSFMLNAVPKTSLTYPNLS